MADADGILDARNVSDMHAESKVTGKTKFIKGQELKKK